VASLRPAAPGSWTIWQSQIAMPIAMVRYLVAKSQTAETLLKAGNIGKTPEIVMFCPRNSFRTSRTHFGVPAKMGEMATVLHKKLYLCISKDKISQNIIIQLAPKLPPRL
jgi:hypothetical protein